MHIIQTTSDFGKAPANFGTNGFTQELFMTPESHKQTQLLGESLCL